MKNSTTSEVSFNMSLSKKTRERLYQQQVFARTNGHRFASLSLREREIFRLICQGNTNEEIAAKLFRSVHTVRTHRNNIWKQLGIRTVVEAVWYGQAFDIV